MTMSDAFGEAMREEMADRERYRLAHVSRCQACGQSATGAEWDLLRHASAMNFALGHVRYLADATQGGNVPAEALLRAVSEPYRFPLPDAPAVLAGIYADLRRLIADYGDDERGVIALMPFTASLDQLFHEKYGFPLPDEESMTDADR